MNRRIPAEHPTKAMEINEVVIFRRRRKSASHCNLNSLYFTVKKTKGEFYGRDIFMFYAIGRDVSIEGSFDEVVEELANSNRTHKYNHQIAYIKCSHGWIYQLEVFDQSLGEVGPFEDPKRCGIGIVLTELCLIDPQINDLKEGNRAFDYLEDQQTAYDFVMKYCQKLVGLKMAAETIGPIPRSGGHTYLTAAIRMRYDRLLINTGDCDDHSYGPPDPNPVKFYEPKIAKDNYVSVTGNINACGRNGRCEAYKQSWFFCSFKKGIKRKRVP